MKILVVGRKRLGQGSRSLIDALGELGHEIRMVDLGDASIPAKYSVDWWRLKLKSSVSEGEERRLHGLIRRQNQGFTPDASLVFKTIHYDQIRLLEALRGIRVHISFDDYLNMRYTTDDYLRHEHLWDSIVTTRMANVGELLARGGRHPFLLRFAFDPAVHSNRVTLPHRRYAIGFIGFCRPDRSDLPQIFTRYFGAESVIYGSGWPRVRGRGDKVALPGRISAEGFADAANKVKIGLVLLNSENRDTYTTRSFETAASGQLVLAQRTAEHSMIFEEGKEAVFFDSIDEAMEIAVKLAKNDSRMEAMANAGYRRIMRDGHTYLDRAKELTKHLESLL